MLRSNVTPVCGGENATPCFFHSKVVPESKPAADNIGNVFPGQIAALFAVI